MTYKAHILLFLYISMQTFLLLFIFSACMTPSELQQPAVLC